LLIALALPACGTGSPVVGLPRPEFNLAFAAALDVVAAERCGHPVDAGLVRHQLVQHVLRRGADAVTADKAGMAFDKTRSEYGRRLTAQPDYCATAAAIPEARLAAYAKGEFPDSP
jgi:hypothetical protein